MFSFAISLSVREGAPISGLIAVGLYAHKRLCLVEGEQSGRLTWRVNCCNRPRSMSWRVVTA